MLHNFDRDAEAVLDSDFSDNESFLTTAISAVDHYRLDTGKQYRSDRMLIKIISKYPKEVLGEVSPSAYRLKPYIYMPLVYTCFSIGTMAAFAMTYLKFFGEMIVTGMISECFGLWCLLFIVSFTLGVFQVLCMNGLM